MNSPQHGQIGSEKSLVSLSALGGPSAIARESGEAVLVRVGYMLQSVMGEMADTTGPDGIVLAAAILRQGLAEAQSSLEAEAAQELVRFVGPVSVEPTVGDLRIAYASVTGWLNGVLSGEKTRRSVLEFLGESVPESSTTGEVPRTKSSGYL